MLVFLLTTNSLYYKAPERRFSELQLQFVSNKYNTII